MQSVPLISGRIGSGNRLNYWVRSLKNGFTFANMPGVQFSIKFQHQLEVRTRGGATDECGGLAKLGVIL
jgi:hypothetical protein